MQKLADKNFALFKDNPSHPSLGFRKKGAVYTAEIGRSYRALARERAGNYYRLWIGTHEEYNNFRF
ncbi:MAG: ParE family toxin-like protein [Chthoniobacterales bacterium]